MPPRALMRALIVMVLTLPAPPAPAYPGIKVEVHRSGSERILQRIMQELSAGIKNAGMARGWRAFPVDYWKISLKRFFSAAASFSIWS